MSSHPYSDFVRGIPMEIHSSFYPAPSVVLPKIKLRPPRQYEYDFSAERGAVLKYEEQRRLQEEAKQLLKESRPKSASPPSTAHPQARAPVLPSSSSSVPVPMTHLWKPSSTSELQALSLSNSANAVAEQRRNLAEFEAPISIFDKLEIECLDDRAELEKLLNLSSSQDETSSTTSDDSRPSTVASTSFPMMKLAPAATNNPYPTLNNYEYPDLSGPTTPASQKAKPSEYSPLQSNPTAAKLLQEGHSETVILACLNSLNSRQVRILEVYVQAVGALVGQGFALSACVKLLQELGDVDKKRVLSVSENVIQLCGMGFDRVRVMDAFRKASGARQAALDILLTH
ncbi:Protein Y51F10.10 [Aphelenchoides avenae]|nr:Protein Y51F10.10 [Aphelenchus avenae]